MKKGFSLVELLIVLAVLAAVVSSVAIFAKNAIRKAKATQVAQNLKSITTSVENKLYLEGFNQLSEISNLSYFGKNVGENYMLYLVTKPNGEVIVNTVFNDLSVNSELVGEILPDAMVATADIQHKLQSGEVFYKIASYVLKSSVSGLTVTIIPKDSIYLSKNIHIF